MVKIKPTKEPLIVKKSPIVIVRNFIVLQFVVMVSFVGAGSLAHYARIYRSFAISSLISFQIAQGLFIFLVEILVIFFIFFRWYKEYFIFHPNKIVHGKGIIYRRRTVISLEQISSVTYKQGPLAKLLKYGTIKLTENGDSKIINLPHLPEPRKHADIILRLKGQDNTVSDIPVPHLKEILDDGEHDGLEFKSTLRWDIRENRVNKALEKAVLKTVAAFLNSDGGNLVIGIDDEKNLLGLDRDYATLGKPDADGFENHFSHIFHNMIGSQFRHKVRLNLANHKGKDYCIINVTSSSVPVYLNHGGNEEFFIRTGNGTTSLKFSEAASYIKSRFDD